MGTKYKNELIREHVAYAMLAQPIMVALHQFLIILNMFFFILNNVSIYGTIVNLKTGFIIDS